MTIKISAIEQKLDRLFEKIKDMDEDEMKSHLSKYLCIQVSGYLENVIKSLMADYHEGTCKKQTERYIGEKFKNFTNVDSSKLENLLKSFDENWKTTFSDSLTDQQITSLNSLIAQRHLIAHGQESQSNISFGNVYQYYRDTRQIVGILQNIIKK